MFKNLLFSMFRNFNIVASTVLSFNFSQFSQLKRNYVTTQMLQGKKQQMMKLYTLFILFTLSRYMI